METVIIDSDNMVLRFDKGEDVIKGLVKFCDERQITAVFFSGLGACGSATLSYYDLKNKKYLDRKLNEDLEIVGLTGNVAKLKKETVIHAHGVFSDKNYQAVGGHVKELIVSATCEIHLTVLRGKMERGYDKKTGLNLLK